MVEHDRIEIVGMVLHFRTTSHTLRCIRSLFANEISHVVIVDNSEDDGASLRDLLSGLASLHAAGLRTTIARPGENLGFATGVKFGLAHLATPRLYHLLLINSDAELELGSIKEMRKLATKFAVVAPALMEGNDTPRSALRYYDKFFGLYTHSAFLSPIQYPSGCCLLIHRDLVCQEMFDTDFFFYGEDVLFGYGLSLHGFVVEECKSALVRHAGSISSQNGSMFYEYHINRSHWLLARKLSRNHLEYFAAITLRCLTLPLRALVRSVRTRSFLPWQGLWCASWDLLHSRLRRIMPLN